MRSLPRANFTSFGMSGFWPSSTCSLKTVGDFFLGHVDGGHDHVRRRLSGELNDPLAQIGFAELRCRPLRDA